VSHELPSSRRGAYFRVGPRGVGRPRRGPGGRRLVRRSSPSLPLWRSGAPSGPPAQGPARRPRRSPGSADDSGVPGCRLWLGAESGSPGRGAFWFPTFPFRPAPGRSVSPVSSVSQSGVRGGKTTLPRLSEPDAAGAWAPAFSASVHDGFDAGSPRTALWAHCSRGLGTFHTAGSPGGCTQGWGPGSATSGLAWSWRWSFALEETAWVQWESSPCPLDSGCRCEPEATGLQMGGCLVREAWVWSHRGPAAGRT
jgi:hypothetical protein